MREAKYRPDTAHDPRWDDPAGKEQESLRQVPFRNPRSQLRGLGHSPLREPAPPPSLARKRPRA